MGCLFGVFDTVPQDEVDEAIEYAKLQARELEQYKTGTMRTRMVLHEACADLELVRSTVAHMGRGTSPAKRVDKPVATVENGSRKSARARKMVDVADLEATAKLLRDGLKQIQAAAKGMASNGKGTQGEKDLEALLAESVASRAALERQVKVAEAATDATLAHIRRDLAKTGEVDLEALKAKLKQLELAKAAAEERAIRAEGLAAGK